MHSVLPKTSQKGFTLAETLITLAIIGVVAALTIPNLLQKYNDQIIISKVKKAHNILTNAFKVAERNNGDFLEYLKYAEKQNIDIYDAAIEYLANSLKISKDCGKTAGNCRPAYWKGCNKNGETKQCDQLPNQNDRCVILDDGMLLCINYISTNKPLRSSPYNVWLHVDINNLKGPNTFSKDDFWWGYNEATKTIETYDATGVAGSSRKDIGCYNSVDANRYRAIQNAVKWILLKDNVDYLHKDVEW